MSNNHISSIEFTTLCQSQITLLAESLGAVWSVVYLAEDAIEDGEAQLFPMAIYPQAEQQNLLELPTVTLSEVWQQLKSHFATQLLPANSGMQDNESQNFNSDGTERKQLILPLVYQETFIGLLATGRNDREWLQTELKQVEEIARTLAIARFLELQYHWSQEALSIQADLRSIEQDRLDNLVHQLRNPLTALRTFSKLLLKRIVPEDSNRKIVTSLLEQSDRFQQLLEQFEAESNKKLGVDSSVPLLEASKSNESSSNFLLPSSHTELNSIDLQDILAPLINTAEAIAADRSIKLHNKIPTSIPEVQGDFSALREIFNNLIDNALKYTASGGQVKLELTTKSEMLGIVIKDSGYGIPEVDRSRIFERHYRGVQGEGDISGTGLGLAIAKELVNKMQGEIELISPNNLVKDSPGSTFIVWLTLAKPHLV